MIKSKSVLEIRIRLENGSLSKSDKKMLQNLLKNETPWDIETRIRIKNKTIYLSLSLFGTNPCPILLIGLLQKLLQSLFCPY